MRKFAKKMLALCLLLPFIQAGSISAEDDGWPSAEYNGNTYLYENVNSLLAGDKNSVEIIGIVVPEGTLELKIPETLDGKKVISLDLSEGVRSQKGGDIGIKKLTLSKNIRPMKVDTETGEKYINFLGAFQDLETIRVAKGSKYLKAEDGVLYNKDMSAMLLYPRKKGDKEYKMPSGVVWSESITNVNVRKLVYSKNKKFSEANATGCKNLESIYLPDNVTKVDSFNSCPKLKKIRWSRNLEVIGDRAFESDVSLTELELPDGVKEIGWGAFRWCHNVRKVSLPESIKHVGKYAFAKVPGIKKVKKATYLLSPRDNKVKGKVPNNYKYVAVVTLITGKKKRYFDSQRVYTLKPSQKKISLKTGKVKTVSINPGITASTPSGFWKGGKMKTDILSFASSDPKVVKVTKKGKIKGLKKGKATIIMRMKTTDVKCRIRVTVN